ncbi:hypothetical protein [Nonomuraea sp. NPDC023979]|uniref:hypothetical protein n=1 Tax=Nonomuraea sp. NPDC023979 TaxID=3154796 RepID=UPI0033DB568F
MGEQYKELGTMASPQELAEVLTTIGLLKRPFTEHELKGEIKRAGSAALLRVELVNALLGVTLHQILMATNAAADAGVDPVHITQASERVLWGINIDTGEPDQQKVLGARMLAEQLQHLLMVLTTELRKSNGASEVLATMVP